MAQDKMNALIMANSLSYTAPVYKSSDAHKKQRLWESFIDSLTWEKLMMKADKSVGKFVRMFRNAKIPIKERKKDKPEGG